MGEERVPELKTGQVVYFKKVKSSSKKRIEDFGFSGHGYAIFLGVVPTFVPDPPMEIITSTLGGIGFFSLSDIEEILGAENAQNFVNKWAEKTKMLLQSLARDAMASGTVKVTGPDGKPLKLRRASDEKPTLELNLPKDGT